MCSAAINMGIQHLFDVLISFPLERHTLLGHAAIYFQSGEPMLLAITNPWLCLGMNSESASAGLYVLARSYRMSFRMIAMLAGVWCYLLWFEFYFSVGWQYGALSIYLLDISMSLFGDWLFRPILEPSFTTQWFEITTWSHLDYSFALAGAW